MFDWYFSEMNDELFDVGQKQYLIRYCKAAENGYKPIFDDDQFTVIIQEIDPKQEMAADAAAHPELYRVLKSYEVVSFKNSNDVNNNNN